MKRILIITPGFMPVPDVIGGAVEALITYIIDENESEKELEISLLTIFNDKINQSKYEYTQICQYKRTLIKKIVDHTCILFGQEMRCDYYNFVVKEIQKHSDYYDYIVVENNILLVNHIINNIDETIVSKMLYHLHNDIETLEYTKENFQLLFDNMIPIICVSQYVANRIRVLCQYSNVFVLRNSIDFEQFDYKSIEKVNYEPSQIVITYVGRIAEYKGVLELVQAFTDLYNKGYHDIVLNIVGSFNNYNGKDDDYTLKVKKAAEGYLVNFWGFVPHSMIEENYQRSDIVVVPSICMEAAGLVAIEAQAAGNAVVLTNHGGIPEYQENESCLYIDEKNGLKNGIVESLKELLDDRNKIMKLKINGYDNSRKYTKKKYYEDFLKLLKIISEEKN